jgi:hypothetical protein
MRRIFVRWRTNILRIDEKLELEHVNTGHIYRLDKPARPLKPQTRERRRPSDGRAPVTTGG